MRTKYIPYIIIVILSVLLYWQYNKEAEIIEVPIRVEVKVPVVENHFDTIREPYPVYTDKIVVDSAYYDLYKNLLESQKDSLFNDAITIREYNQIADDTIQTINVFSRVQGFLKDQQISYKTKPRTVFLDTVLEVKVPYKPRFGIGAEFGFLKGEDLLSKFNVVYDRKDIIYSASFDTEKRVWGGFTYKF